jgi:hypothetical protein
MLLVGLGTWWYGAGWRAQLKNIGGMVAAVADAFSLTLLVKTLFAPFHQIDANTGGRNISEQMQAAFSRLFSRVFGFFLRTFMLIFGCVAIILTLVLAGVRLVIWPLLPLAPVVGVLLMILLKEPLL